jgi:6-pyruvoyltetrahydropterin/6-carboxytetrahydropterin synthase
MDQLSVGSVQMKVSKTFTFEAAHFIPGHPKCGKTHGHSYKLEVIVRAPVKDGMVIDFHTFGDIVRDHVIEHLDHAFLNKLVYLNPRMAYPTAENIAFVIWIILEPTFDVLGMRLVAVRVWETATAMVEYDGS